MRAIKTVWTFAVIITLTIWTQQQSIDAYIQQHFHRQNPLNILQDFGIWTFGAELNNKLKKLLLPLTPNQESQNLEEIKDLYQEDLIPQLDEIELEEIDQEEKKSIISLCIPSAFDKDPCNQGFNEYSEKIYISERNIVFKAFAFEISKKETRKVTITDRKSVLFIGDSLMQGVVPHAALKLKRSKVRSVNLSKRSTGLSYPKSFNWPIALKNALTKDRTIGLLVVFLGANDPWDFPSQKTGRYLKFGTRPWIDEYSQRIESILNLAQQFHVPVIWIGAPNVKKDNLNKGIQLLNTLYKSEVEKYGQIYLASNTILGMKGDEFKAYAYVAQKNKEMRIRSEDGVHFTPTGQMLIAEALMSHIQFGFKY